MKRILVVTSTLLLVFGFNFETYAQTVKMSSSKICHDTSSSYYSRTKNFTAYDSLEECLNAGGRLPKKYSGKISKPEVASGYSRDLFEHWIDEDNDGLDTRAEILQKLSTAQVVINKYGTVKKGRWNDPYTGRVFYNASDVDVDHVVPLKWAYDRGADKWSYLKKRRFANDERNLLVVDDATNQSKGARGPASWLPPNEKFECQYLTRYERMMRIYEFEQRYLTPVTRQRQEACQ